MDKVREYTFIKDRGKKVLVEERWWSFVRGDKARFEVDEGTAGKVVFCNHKNNTRFNDFDPFLCDPSFVMAGSFDDRKKLVKAQVQAFPNIYQRPAQVIISMLPDKAISIEDVEADAARVAALERGGRGLVFDQEKKTATGKVETASNDGSNPAPRLIEYDGETKLADVLDSDLMDRLVKVGVECRTAVGKVAPKKAAPVVREDKVAEAKAAIERELGKTSGRADESPTKKTGSTTKETGKGKGKAAKDTK